MTAQRAAQQARQPGLRGRRTPAPLSARDVSRRFAQGKRAEKKVEDVLRTLAVLGQAQRAGTGYILTS